MKYFWLLIGVVVWAVIVHATSSPVRAQSFDVDPFNWNNSINNWDNSPSNFRNSKDNWDNNPNNFYSKNGLYDNAGARVGYEVREANGTTNYYDNNGNRVGYNSRRKQ